MRDMLCSQRSFEYKVAIGKKALAMYQLFYENEDYGFEEGMVAQVYEKLAKLYLEMNCNDLALEAIEQYIIHSMKQAEIMHRGFSYSSVMFDHLKFEKDDYTRGYIEKEEEKLLHYLENPIYDKIRNTERFQKMQEKLI